MLKFFKIIINNYIDDKKRLKTSSLTILLNFKIKFLFILISINIFIFIFTHYNIQRISKKMMSITLLHCLINFEVN
jgi:hypothetical protein